jgi:hypothetical protein
MSKQQLRAIMVVGLRGRPKIEDGKVVGWLVFGAVEQKGLTMATEVRTQIEQLLVPRNPRDPNDWEKVSAQTFPLTHGVEKSVAGPGDRRATKLIEIPLKDAMDVWEEKRYILIHARVDYQDIFDRESSPHWHEVTTSVVFVNNPSEVPPKDFDNLNFGIIGPQNTFN